MKQLFNVPFFACILIVFDLSAQVVPQVPGVIYSDGIPLQTRASDTGAACTGGEIHDDGTFENAYGWNNNVTDARWVIKFRPSQYPWQYDKACISLTRLSSGSPGFGFRIVAYDSSGPGGIPGALLFTSDSFSVTNIPVFPQHAWYSFENLNLPPVTGGAVYIGIRYDASPQGQAAKFVGADETASTPMWQGYTRANEGPWTSVQTFFSNYRCLGIRTEGTSTVGISGNQNRTPAHFTLEQNYPNPFNSSTLIRYALPREGHVRLTVYDLLGSEIKVLINEFQQPGYYSISFDASGLAGGVYFFKISAQEFSAARKMILLR